MRTLILMTALISAPALAANQPCTLDRSASEDSIAIVIDGQGIVDICDRPEQSGNVKCVNGGILDVTVENGDVKSGIFHNNKIESVACSTQSMGDELEP